MDMHNFDYSSLGMIVVEVFGRKDNLVVVGAAVVVVVAFDGFHLDFVFVVVVANPCLTLGVLMPEVD